MHIITVNAHSLTTDQRPDGKHCREVFLEEDVTCSASPPIVSISLVDGPAGTPPTISGGTLAFFETGRYLLKVEFSDGKSAHLHIVACEMAAADRVPNQPQDLHLPPRDLAAKALILRSLCNHAPSFDGTAESISFDCVGSLAQYGA